MDYEKKDIIKVKYGRNRTQLIRTDGALIPIRSGGNNRHEDGTPSPFAEENYKRRNKRRKAVVKEKCFNSFFYDRSVALTLTFDEKKCRGFDPKDIKSAHKAFHLFIQRINRRYDNFTYVATFSRHKRSKQWHYHLICNFTHKITNKDVAELWQYGKVYVSNIKNFEQFQVCVNYLIKNLMEYPEDKQGVRGYLASCNAKSDKVLSSLKFADAQKFQDYYDKINKHGVEEIYSCKTANIERTKTCSSGAEVKEYIPNTVLARCDVLNGFTECFTTTTCYSSPVRFSKDFPALKSAAPKLKKPQSPVKSTKAKKNMPTKKQSKDNKNTPPKQKPKNTARKKKK